MVTVPGAFIRTRISANIDHEVRNILVRLLVPREVTRHDILSYIRKALRTGAWYSLNRAQRSLLWLASRVVNVVRSPVLKKVLKEIFLQIELAGVKGRALYYGLLVMLSRGITLKDAARNLSTLLYVGIGYLNNPPPHGIAG